MLIIRKEQVDKFKENSIKDFEKTLIQHVQSVAPEIASIAGEANVRSIVQVGIRKAFGYGFSYQGTVRFYIDLMLLLGCGFDDDPQFPWASKILNSSDSRGEMFRSKKLFIFLNDYLDTVHGEKNIYLTDAIDRFSTMSKKNTEYYYINNHHECLSKIKFIFPQKFEYIGEQALLDIMKEAKNIAVSLNMFNKSSFMVITILMFSFGYKVFEDPLYPWVYSSLNKGELIESKRIQITYNKLNNYLDHALINLKG